MAALVAQARSIRSDNPFTRSFWLGAVDPRPFAIFRIGLGLSVLHDLVDLTRDLRAFYADDGMLPRGLAKDGWTWGVFDWVGGMPGVWTLYALGVLAVVAFTVGFQTRAATLVSWLFITSLHHRNYFVTDGGDDLTRILFFWAIFCDLGARYGVDAWRAQRAVSGIRAFGPRLLQAHVAILYLVAAILKLRLHWLRGDAIYLTLQLDGFVRPFGAWLLQHPALCKLATRAIVLMELAFPFAAFSPVWPRASRAATIALGAAIQLGILVAMRVGIFTEVMLCVLAMWLDPAWIDRAERWVRARRGGAPPVVTPFEGGPIPPALAALYAVIGAQFVVAVWDPFLAHRLPLPRVLRDERSALGILQPFGLFDVTYAVPHWEARGVLTDGTPVEVLSVVAPGAQPRGPGVSFSRWNKFTFKGIEHPFFFPELGAYLCRAYDEQAAGAKLASFTLVDMATPPHGPDAPQAPVERKELARVDCRQPAGPVAR